ncbi:MAG: response regulator [Paraglaciecola sp.]|uniref:response regulator n=1 Tax=Paraglaciecola sp. TaxID=1920173 RepID=UPI00273EAAC4|nr:response regulator [Paraglaciecola sp.]MDP5030497.1 response regulator [Paraglaciecola sp.]MDP5131905.1 response regulator [Paraglaciecola sp.]
MLPKNLNVAVVEDNELARSNIRNHLLDMGFSDIASFTNGRELKANLKFRHFDILLMDYHLGQNKNGVEVVQELRHLKLLKHATCLMFITADRLPLIIGQIVDIQPEALIVKPYTIGNFSKSVSACVKLHLFLLPIYQLMDQNRLEQALDVAETLCEANQDLRKLNPLIKLKARILTKLERYSQATALYREVLQGSDKVMWAKWGLIQNLFLDNHIQESQSLLHELTKAQLTSNRASEWLARISLDANQYSRAESYMQQIREGDLSLSATRLKAFIYQGLERGKEAIALLERKRESNRSVRERFEEITLDLARCYLFEAEEKASNERANDLNIAKALVGSVGRRSIDGRLAIQKNYMFATIAQLEGNQDKVKEIVDRPGMENLLDAEISTLFDAININYALGKPERAQHLLELSYLKQRENEEGNDKAVSKILLVKNQEVIEERKPKALEINKYGLEKYAAKNYVAALKDFYRAYTLFPREIAFSLNILQSLVEAQIEQFKEISLQELLDELLNRRLNGGNKKRLEDIVLNLHRKQKAADNISQQHEPNSPPAPTS